MDGIKHLIRTEPAIIVGLVQSAIGLGMAFGLGWTAEQVTVVLLFTQTLLSVIARSMVTPMATVEETVDDLVAEQTRVPDGTRLLTAEELATLEELRQERDYYRGRLQTTDEYPRTERP